MHEMAIANSILEAVRAEALHFPGQHVSKVGVRIGELAGVDPDALQFCFEALVLDTDFAPLTLEVEYRARREQCNACGNMFAATLENFVCPQCGAADSRFAAGDELQLAYLEVEDGACAAGA